jgi:hypothetical protein
MVCSDGRRDGMEVSVFPRAEKTINHFGRILVFSLIRVRLDGSVMGTARVPVSLVMSLTLEWSSLHNWIRCRKYVEIT